MTAPDPQIDAQTAPRLDHLVVACLSLADSLPGFEARLGVPAQGGGAHAGMGTHNALWGLDGGDAHGRIYIELIAPDPAQPKPDGAPLPFALHRADMRARLAGGPRLVTWMARCGDLDLWAPRSSAPLGPIRAMRRGDLQWRLTVPDGEGLPFGGVVPGLIQWPDGITLPGEAMAGAGLTLLRFERAPNAAAGAALASLGLFDTLPEAAMDAPAEAPLRAVIAGPAGEATLD
ncbi:MAG: VOC family protein [Pseudomonadota bacterium]